MRPSPLPNRVTPTGEIIAVPDRGDWMGNRGCIHRSFKITKKPPTTRWIICRLKFKDWHRPVMSERKYTELFFLDEATALAAGHRPCFLCRHQDAVLFSKLVGANSMAELDARLNAERTLPPQSVQVNEYPDGTMFGDITPPICYGMDICTHGIQADMANLLNLGITKCCS